MKTSKIKEVANMNPWTSNTGKTIIYHSLVMENGDKINIGKMKEQLVGWELTYEITEEGQQEYNKAKAVSPNNFGGGFKGDDKKQEFITRSLSLKCSIAYNQGAEASLEEIFETAEHMILWLNKAEVNKAVSEELNGRVQMDRQDNNNSSNAEFDAMNKAFKKLDNDLPF
tara:strand:+ start:70 stop:579 length:510 start_codon:yes stop_codon:yes gene_type:complete